MYKISFYVPKTHCESVKNALFSAGAGKIGQYENCAWQTSGTGQYRPLSESEPYHGDKGKLCHADEYKVEMICDNRHIKNALETLIESHPYETPAYEAYPFVTADDFR